jgi:hypothetical protein
MTMPAKNRVAQARKKGKEPRSDAYSAQNASQQKQ